MLYKLHNGTSLFPIGIVLTSYGSDRKSYIDVYGGTDVNPVARMGNLGGLTYKDYSDPDPTEDILANQWGFYTKDNAYFQGHIPIVFILFLTVKQHLILLAVLQQI